MLKVSTYFYHWGSYVRHGGPASVSVARVMWEKVHNSEKINGQVTKFPRVNSLDTLKLLKQIF